jgi:hypothetical protein
MTVERVLRGLTQIHKQVCTYVLAPNNINYDVKREKRIQFKTQVRVTLLKD